MNTDPNMQTNEPSGAGSSDFVFNADPQGGNPPATSGKPGDAPAPDASGQPASPNAPVAAASQGTGAPQAPSLTPEAIAAAVRAALPQQQQQQAAPQQQMTLEQYKEVMRQQFGVRDFTQEDFDVIMNGGEAAVARFNDLLQATLRSAALMAQFNTQREIRTLTQQLQPVLSTHQEQTRKALFTEFTASYPELKDYEPVVELVAQQARQAGRSFATKKEAFDFVAATVKQLIKLPTQTTQPVKQGQRTTPTPVAVGGQGAGGKLAATPTTEAITPKALFGNAKT